MPAKAKTNGRKESRNGTPSGAGAKNPFRPAAPVIGAGLPAGGYTGRTPWSSRREKNDPDTLRRIAEEKLAALKERSALADDRTREQLIHELQVNQIELEMQNEELRKVHRALEASWDKYIDLYEFAPVGYLTLTRTGRIGEANMTGSALFGVDRLQLMKGRFRDYVDPADLDRWDRYFATVLQSPEKQNCDLALRKSDGSRFHGRLESLRMDHALRQPVVRVAVSDVTAEKQAQEALIRKSDEVRAANEELTAAGNQLRKNEVRLTDSLTEKEALLAEVHHRVKNNLAAFISLLSLNGMYEDTESGRKIKNDLQNRAWSMALAHETLYRTGNFSSVDMEMYLTNLISRIAGSSPENGDIRTIVDTGGVDLDLGRATTAGLIVTELLTNSYKHAFPPSFDCRAVRGEQATIRVGLTREGGSYLLSVADNGTGMPHGFDPLAAKTPGLRLVNFLARHQLRAETRADLDKGTEFIFRMDTGDKPLS